MFVVVTNTLIVILHFKHLNLHVEILITFLTIKIQWERIIPSTENNITDGQYSRYVFFILKLPFKADIYKRQNR